MAAEAQVQGGGWEAPLSTPLQALLCSDSSGPWPGTVRLGPQPLPVICLTNEAQSRRSRPQGCEDTARIWLSHRPPTPPDARTAPLGVEAWLIPGLPGIFLTQPALPEAVGNNGCVAN